MEPQGFVDNMIYGTPPGQGHAFSMGLFDILVSLAILYFYLRMPLRAIDRTCDLMYAYPAYGEDPVAWRNKMIKKYWQIPAKFGVGLVIVGLTIAFMLPTLVANLSPDLYKIVTWLMMAYFVICMFLIPFWPLKIWRDAKVEEVTIKHVREQAIEDRIAAGLATKSDMAYYIKSVKEKEYWRGYRAGRR